MTTKIFIAVVFFVLFFNLSQAPFNFGLLRFLVVVPLLYIITLKGASWRKAGSVLFIAGFLGLLWQYSPILSLSPFDWAGVATPVASSLIATGLWVLVSALAALSFIVLFPVRKSIFLAPFLWVSGEYLRSIIYSILVFGPSSSVGDIFSFGFLAYSAHTSPFFLATASFLGIYGLSFFIAVINLCIFLLLRSWGSGKAWPRAVFFVLISMLLAQEFVPASFWDASREDGRVIRAVLFQEDNPALLTYTDSYYRKRSAARLDLFEDVFDRYPDADIFVLSENSQFMETLEASPDLFKRFHDSFGKKESRLLIDGGYDSEENVSVALLFESGTKTPLRIEKSLLMPMGEYQPYALQVFARIFGASSWYETLEANKNTRSVIDASKAKAVSFGTVAVVACSEIMSPRVYQAIEKEGADIVVHQQRLAHFHGDTKLFYQTLAISRLRAAEIGKPIIGSVDGSGYSYAISSRGELLRLGKPGEPYLAVEIPI